MTGDGPGQSGLDVAFLGTPDFAATVLKALVTSRHRVVRVVTQPDRPRGRGLRCVPSPVAAEAEASSLPLTKLAPGSHGRLLAVLAADSPDVIVTTAWAGLVRSAARSQARLAALNVHASLLPRWRGAAPIERAIMAGDEVSGVTIIHMSDELDAGDILIARAEAIPGDKDAGWLRERLAALGAGLLLQALDLLACGTTSRVPQPGHGVTIARKLMPADERIDWKQPARTIHNQIRALSPKPGAYFEHRGGRVIAVRAEAADLAVEASPGTVIGKDSQALLVAAGDRRVLRLLVLKPAGGREMPAGAFANGRGITPGHTFEEGGP